MKDYHINIFTSDEDGGYIADIPDLKTCSAFGATAEVALREVETAREALLDAARAEGKPIPKPNYRPAIYQIGDQFLVECHCRPFGAFHLSGNHSRGSGSLKLEV